MIELIQGDCRELMATLPEASVDAIVTDPPYELGFMGKGWDKSGVANDVRTWREALRVLKPGGHLLAFSGTRTYHRMVCAIEDAGFEIRDQIGWAYGSGFPKSLDVSKAIDKAAGAEREVVGHQPDRWTNKGTVLNFATDRPQDSIPITGAPATDAALQWQGWGTALKPAWEPIVVARKPLVGTVAENVLQHGTGALNIDGCRVGMSQADREFILRTARPNSAGKAHVGDVMNRPVAPTVNVHQAGRWPANLIHDGSEEVVALFPDSNGSGPARTLKRGERHGGEGWGMADQPGELRDAGGGSAARFFYCAKASKRDRGEGNTHPTVKPTELMRYLCRLVTPPGGVVLDPFAGSGSTGKAAQLEGFRFIGIDLDEAHIAIARNRLGIPAPELDECPLA